LALTRLLLDLLALPGQVTLALPLFLPLHLLRYCLQATFAGLAISSCGAFDILPSLLIV